MRIPACFNIDSIKWTGGKAEVHGGYYEGPLDAAGSVYTVEKLDGKWKITGEKLEEIA